MKKPNVVLITADQMRLDALGCYGNNIIKTPNIDRLARDGIIFENHYCQSPVCSPSRATVLTGKYPRNHGLSQIGMFLKSSEETLPELLKSCGYETAAVGKMHFVPSLLVKEKEDELWPENKYGFNRTFLTCDAKKGDYLDDLKKLNPEAYSIVWEQGQNKVKEDLASAAEKINAFAPQVFENKLDPKYHQTTWIADKTIDIIEKSKDGPFFIWCSFVDPHHPFDPPVPYDSMYDTADMPLPARGPDNEMDDKPPHFKKMLTGKGVGNERYRLCDLTDDQWRLIISRYYGMISLMDHNIGRIIRTLQENDLYEDTIIIFTSDHGELLGDHRLLFKGPYLYDSVIRIPMIMKTNKCHAKGAGRIRYITQHTDLMPTLLEFANIHIPSSVQGKSLADYAKGKNIPVREFAFLEYDDGNLGLKARLICSKEWKLVYYAGEKYGELYDLIKDPGEIVNQWNNDQYSDVKEMLKTNLIDKMVETEGHNQIRAALY